MYDVGFFMNKNIFFVVLLISSLSYAMNQNNKLISDYDLQQRKFVVKKLPLHVYNQVGHVYDDKLLAAKRKLFFTRYQSAFDTLQLNKLKNALKQFAFALKIANELPHDFEIHDATMHAKRMIAHIYQEKKQYDKAEAWLQLLVDQGDRPAHIGLTALLEEKIKLVIGAEQNAIYKKLKDLYGYLAATGNHYAKSRYAHLLVKEDKIKQAVRDFSFLLNMGNEISARHDSLKGLSSAADQGDLQAQCVLISNIKQTSYSKTKCIEIFDRMLQNFVIKMSQQENNISFDDVVHSIQVFESHCAHFSEQSRFLLGQAYYEVASCLSKDKQSECFKKAWYYFRKINTPKALCYKLFMNLYGLGISQSLPHAYQIIQQLELSKEGIDGLKAVFSIQDQLLIDTLNIFITNGGKKSFYAAYILAKYHGEHKNVQDEYTCLKHCLDKNDKNNHLKIDNEMRFSAAYARLMMSGNAYQIVTDIVPILKPVFLEYKKDKSSHQYNYFIKSYEMLMELDKQVSDVLINQKHFDLCYQIIHCFLQHTDTVGLAFQLMQKVEMAISKEKDISLFNLIKTSGVYSKFLYWAHQNHPAACDALGGLYLLRGLNNNDAAYLLSGDSNKQREKGLFYFKKMLDLYNENKPDYKRDIDFYCEHCTQLACIYCDQGNIKKALKYWNNALEYDYEPALMNKSIKLIGLDIKDDPNLAKEKCDAMEQLIKKADQLSVETLDFIAQNLLHVNKELALKYAQKAVEKGGKIAYRVLGHFYDAGLKKNNKWIIEPNQEQALHNYTQAIQAGDYTSLFYRAKTYYDQNSFDNAYKDFSAFLEHINKDTNNDSVINDNRLIVALSSWYKGKISFYNNKEDAIDNFYNAFIALGRTGGIEEFFDHIKDNEFLFLEQKAKNIVTYKKKEIKGLELCYYIGRLLHKNNYTEQDQHQTFKKVGLKYICYAADNGDLWSAWYLGHMDKQNIEPKNRHKYLWEVFNNTTDEILKGSAIGLFKEEADLGYIPATAHLLACYALQKRFQDIDDFLKVFYVNYELILCHTEDSIPLTILKKSDAFGHIKELAERRKGSVNAQNGAKLILGACYLSSVQNIHKDKKALDSATKYLEEVKRNIPIQDSRVIAINQILGKAYYKMGLWYEAYDMKQAILYWQRSVAACTHQLSLCKVFENTLDGLCYLSNMNTVVNKLKVISRQQNDPYIMFLLGRYYLEKENNIKLADQFLVQAKNLGYTKVDGYMEKMSSRSIKNILSAKEKQNDNSFHVSLDPKDIEKLIAQEISSEFNNKQYQAITKIEKQKKYKQVGKKLTALANKKHPHACIKLASYYLTGENKYIKANIDSAMYYLEKGLDSGGLTKDKKYLDREIANLIFQPFIPIQELEEVDNHRQAKAFLAWINMLNKKDAPKITKKKAE